MDSTAAAARSTSSSTSCFCARLNGASTNFAPSPIGWPGWIPRRTRGNSCVPRLRITDFTPLCPPPNPSAGSALRPRQIQLVVNQHQAAPAATVSFQQPLHRRAAQIHERLRLGQQHALAADLAQPDQRLESLAASTRMPLRSASRSITRKPRLCGVFSYSAPGFPRPTIKPRTSSGHRCYFFFFLLLRRPAPSSSFLPFLMTSGSAAGAAALRPPPAQLLQPSA